MERHSGTPRVRCCKVCMQSSGLHALHAILQLCMHCMQTLSFACNPAALHAMQAHEGCVKPCNPAILGFSPPPIPRHSNLTDFFTPLIGTDYGPRRHGGTV